MGHIVPKRWRQRITSRVSSRTTWNSAAKSKRAGRDLWGHRKVDDDPSVVTACDFRSKIRYFLVKNMDEWIWVTPETVDGMDVVTPKWVYTQDKKSWMQMAKLFKKIAAIIIQKNL